MIIVIDTQFMENYGAHDWDGQGECPQRWKMKGGSSYKVRNVPADADVKSVVELRFKGWVLTQKTKLFF